MPVADSGRGGGGVNRVANHASIPWQIFILFVCVSCFQKLKQSYLPEVSNSTTTLTQLNNVETFSHSLAILERGLSEAFRFA